MAKNQSENGRGAKSQAASRSEHSTAAQPAGSSGEQAEKGRESLPNRVAHGVASINAHLPFLPYLGLGMWMAWNLLAFSGSPWLEDRANSWPVSTLFVIHLGASVVTLALFALNDGKLRPLVSHTAFPFIGAVVALAGAVLAIVARPSMLSSAAVFFAGSICTGLGTSLIFIRGIMLFGALRPRESFIRISEALLFACATYCTVQVLPDLLASALFALLPAFAAVLLTLRPYSFAERTVMEHPSRFTPQFASFLVAVVVFATSAQIMKSGLYPLPYEDAVRSHDFMVMAVMFTSIVLIVGCAASSKPFGFARIYAPATLAIIALLIIAPMADLGALATGALSSAANYTFNLMVWGMLAYIVFQAQGSALRVFCLGNAALAFGSVLGSAASGALTASGISDENFTMLCLVFALISIVVSLFVFPEHKIGELLLPVDETQFEQPGGEDRFAPWKEACASIARDRGLSSREEEVFTLLARGKTTQQVSDALVISPYTTRAHTRSIYTKLDVHSRAELADVVSSRVKGEPHGESGKDG